MNERVLPMLDSTALGRHLLAAEEATTARALLGAAAGVDLPTDGTTDVAPYVQAAYDGGAQMLQLTSGVTYVWDSPVFLDRDSVLGGFVIEGNRARIKLGGSLPRTNWLRDTVTRFAVFPNTNRSALTSGVVTVSPSTRATGGAVGAVRPLTIRNVVIDGNGTNVGFSYANRAGVTFDQVTLWRARVGATWADYSDGNAFLNCYSRYGGAPSTQAMVEQVAPGDGIVILGGKADTAVAFARLKGCRGAVIQGVVTARLVFEECDAILVQGSHFEGQDSSSPMITVRNSRVTLSGCALYQTYSQGVPSISLDDSATSLVPTDLTLNECTSMQLITGADPDVRFSPVVAIGTTLKGTRLTVRGLQGKQASTTASGHWRDTAQPSVQATKSSSVQDALDSPVGRTALAAGDLQLRRNGDGWEIAPSGGGPTVSRRQSGAPTITSVAATSASSPLATLSIGSSYAYSAAVQDALGNYTAVSDVVTGMPDSSGMLMVEVTLANPPGVLVVWRADDLMLPPDRYAVLPVRAASVSLPDTGDHIAGVPWLLSGIPLPSKVATANDTQDALLFGRLVVSG